MAELKVSTLVQPELQVQKFEFDSNVNRFVQPFRMMIAGKYNKLIILKPTNNCKLLYFMCNFMLCTTYYYKIKYVVL